MKQYVTAIDIGTTKIVAVAGVKEAGKVKILGTGTVPTPQDSVKRGVVLNIEQASQAIFEAVQIAEKKSGVKFMNTYVGIAGQHIKSQQNSHSLIIDSEGNQIEQVNVDDLREQMYNISLEPGEVIIHIIPQNYTVDKETGVKQPVGMYGKRITGNFHIVIGEITSAKNIERCIERLQINVSGMLLEPIASSAAVLSEDEKEAGVALVDIGGGTTDIAIYYDGILRYTAVIPYGGNVITSDIRVGCSILHKTAESLKVKHGRAFSDGMASDISAVIPGIAGRDPKKIDLTEVANIINYRLKEIIGTIDFHIVNSGYRNKLGAGISLTGGGALLHLLPEFMKKMTGQDVRLAFPNKEIIANNPEMNSPKYSTVVGLLILGFQSLNGGETLNDTIENVEARKKQEEFDRLEAIRLEELAEEEARKAADLAAKEAKEKEVEEQRVKDAADAKAAEQMKEEEARSGRNIFTRIKEQMFGYLDEEDTEME